MYVFKYAISEDLIFAVLVSWMVLVFQSLLEGLEEVDPDLWKDIIALQQNWIGKCDGVRLEFPLMVSHSREAGRGVHLLHHTKKHCYLSELKDTLCIMSSISILSEFEKFQS